MDLGDVFELGMGYVALSRVRRLDGLKLMNLNELALKVNPKILKQDHQFLEDSKRVLHELKGLSEATIEQVQKQTLLQRFKGRVPSKTFIAQSSKTKSPLKVDRTPTRLLTVALLKQGLSLAEIAEKRGLSIGTVVNHLEKLRRLNQVAVETLEPLRALIPPADFASMMASLRQSTEGRLKPLYEQFEGRYSYDELKIVRLFLEQECEIAAS